MKMQTKQKLGGRNNFDSCHFKRIVTKGVHNETINLAVNVLGLLNLFYFLYKSFHFTLLDNRQPYLEQHYGDRIN